MPSAPRFSSPCLRRVLTILLLTAGPIAPLAVRSAPAEPSALPVGSAKGTFSPEDKPAVMLTNATAFIDRKDADKPTILILSDKKLPAEKWTSEFDLMMAHPAFTGLVLWLNAEGVVYRSDTYDQGKQASVSGLFELKLGGAMGKDLTGTVHGGEKSGGKGPKADVAFHAVVP